jgi:GNAT superfamily N-acetyltransferase
LVEIREITSRGDLKKFVRFPLALYKDNPYYTPPMETDELQNLRRDQNAAYEYCDTRFWLAYRDGKIVGRICGLHSKLANEVWNVKRMRFTRYDFIDDEEVSQALMEKVEGWAKELGLTEVQGPIGFCDLDYEGMLIEGFEEFNMFVTIYNAPYYLKHLERMGYGKDVDWVERRLEMPKELDPKYAKAGQFVFKKMNLRTLTLKRTKDVMPYVPRIFRLLNEAYAPLYGAVPLTEKMIAQYTNRFFGFVNPDYLSVIVNSEDEVVGFAVAIPTLARAAKSSNGRLFPLGWARYLHDLKHNDTLELLLVAVHPSLQRLGLNGIMIHDIYERALKNNIKWAETGPTLEENYKIQAQWSQFPGRMHKRRRCFIKQLS